MNFWGLFSLDTEWKNQSCARMKCERSFYIYQFFSWNDNWHLLLFLSGMNWCDSVGGKIPLKGLRSLSSRNILNGWCYSIAHIWIWLVQTIVTHPLMTPTVTKKLKWKVRLCNLHVRVLDMMKSWHSVRFSKALLFPKDRLGYLFHRKQNCAFTEYA